MADDVRQAEVAFDLRRTAQTEYSVAAGVINEKYRALKAARKQSFDAAYTVTRDELARVRRAGINVLDPEGQRAQPRDEALIRALETRLRELKARPAPTFDDLEAQRLAELKGGPDEVLRRKLADIDVRVRRGLLTDKMVFAPQQQRYIPEGAPMRDIRSYDQENASEEFERRRLAAEARKQEAHRVAHATYAEATAADRAAWDAIVESARQRLTLAEQVLEFIEPGYTRGSGNKAYDLALDNVAAAKVALDHMPEPPTHAGHARTRDIALAAADRDYATALARGFRSS